MQQDNKPVPKYSQGQRVTCSMGLGRITAVHDALWSDTVGWYGLMYTVQIDQDGKSYGGLGESALQLYSDS